MAELSYSLNDPCYNCNKKENCTDKQDLRDAIDKIHAKGLSNVSGHMGSGQVVLACVTQNKE